ncbi:MAG TPA: HAD family hydrolase [Acidimicrobiia bacterium]|nr:HAD family hydrolase [Acidimicrobiia bacterium]
MVKAIVFDFYNTLAETTHFGPSWEELMAELGYDLPADVRERWWNDGIDGTEHDAHSVSRDHYIAWQQSRVRAMLSECGVPNAAQDEFIARVREIGAHNRIDAYEEVDVVLDDLRSRGYALAICSNWDWDLHDAIDSAGLTGRFDVVVSSAWVGARKQHPRIYTHTLGELNVAAGDALFVGDTWTCDVAGPRAAGMRAIYLRRVHLGDDRTAPPVPERPRDVVHGCDLRVVAQVAAGEALQS